MQNFHKIGDKVDIRQVMAALTRQPELWGQNPYRKQFADSMHTATEDIILRFQDIEMLREHLPTEGVIKECFHSLDVIDFPALDALPQVRPLIFDLMRLYEATRLGRVMITKLPPGGKIGRHVDQGRYSEYYDRVHIILQADGDFRFYCGEEVAHMKTGEIWWFNNQVEHELLNNGTDDRISLIIDLGCK